MLSGLKAMYSWLPSSVSTINKINVCVLLGDPPQAELRPQSKAPSVEEGWAVHSTFSQLISGQLRDVYIVRSSLLCMAA